MNESSNLPNIIDEESIALIRKNLIGVREEVIDNPYLAEALKVLKVGGLRSAIGSYWNAVVDDLRKKVMHRSLTLFNKETKKMLKYTKIFKMQ